MASSVAIADAGSVVGVVAVAVVAAVAAVVGS